MTSWFRLFICAAAFLTGSLISRAELKTAAGGGSYEALDLKVLKVYRVKDGGYVFRAYLVDWNGQEVIAWDPIQHTEAYTDNTVRVLVTYNPFPKGRESYGLLNFTVTANKSQPRVPAADSKAAIESGEPAAPPEPVLRPQVVPLKVLKVYAVESDGCIYRSYLVEWMGQEAIVADPLVHGRYNEGDMMPTLVMRIPYPRGARPEGLLVFQANRPSRFRKP